MQGTSNVDEACAWLEDFLNMVGGSKESRFVKEAGRRRGHAEHTLKRAAAKLKIIYTSEGKPRTPV